MTQRPKPDQRSTQDAGERDTLSQAATQATPASRTRRTLGSITRATASAAPATNNKDIASAATHALQSAPSGGSRALIEASEKPVEKPVVIKGARNPKLPARHIVPRRSGPRSFIAQFVVAMIATAMVAGVLAISTPLGEAASLSAGGSLQAVSGSVPWIPTPTATPKPKPAFRPPPGANPGQQAVINEIVAVFGPYAQGALGVSKCESGYDPNAWNSYPILGSHASGVFQILYPSTWNTTSYASQSPFNANANIHAAYQIFHRDGNSWREWQCQPSGHV